jgi:predicted aspartyl protease
MKLAAASSSVREEVLSEVVGHVDPRGRPIISISILGEEDAFPVIVDTGFNGGLLLHDSEIIRHTCELTGLNVPIELADRAPRMLMLARTRIVWFGQPRDVDVLIAPTQVSRAAIADEPIGLLGSALLAPHRLTGLISRPAASSLSKAHNRLT